MSRDARYSAAAFARVLSGAADGVGSATFGVPSIASLLERAQRVTGTRYTADQLIDRRAPRDLYRIYDAVLSILDAPGLDAVAAPISSLTALPGYTEYRGVAASDPIAKLKVAYLLAAAYRASDRGLTERKGAAFARAALSLAEDGRHQGEEQGSARLIYSISDIYTGGLNVFRAHASTISNPTVRAEIEQALRAGTDSTAVRTAISRSQDSAAALRAAKDDIEDEARKDSFLQNLMSESGSTTRWAIGAAALSAVAIAALVLSRRNQAPVAGTRANPLTNPQTNPASALYVEGQHPLPPAADAQRRRIFAAMQQNRRQDGD